MRKLIHVELASGRKPDVLDYAAALMLGGVLAVGFAPAIAVLGAAKILAGKKDSGERTE